jgi:hypothetical protein
MAKAAKRDCPIIIFFLCNFFWQEVGRVKRLVVGLGDLMNAICEQNLLTRQSSDVRSTAVRSTTGRHGYPDICDDHTKQNELRTYGELRVSDVPGEEVSHWVSFVLYSLPTMVTAQMMRA